MNWKMIFFFSNNHGRLIIVESKNCSLYKIFLSNDFRNDFSPIPNILEQSYLQMNSLIKLLFNEFI